MTLLTLFWMVLHKMHTPNTTTILTWIILSYQHLKFKKLKWNWINLLSATICWWLVLIPWKGVILDYYILPSVINEQVTRCRLANETDTPITIPANTAIAVARNTSPNVRTQFADFSKLYSIAWSVYSIGSLQWRLNNTCAEWIRRIAWIFANYRLAWLTVESNPNHWFCWGLYIFFLKLVIQN